MGLPLPPLSFDENRAVDWAPPHLPAPTCRNCDVESEVAVCSSLGHDEVRKLATVRAHAQLPGNFTLFREGDSAVHVYSVSSGVVKLYKMMPDGRRQITAFLFAGDMFGLAHDGFYVATAETVSASRVCRFAHRKLDSLLHEIPKLERRIFSLAVKDLIAAQEQMLLLGRKTAREKVASFLLLLARRQEKAGMAPSPVALPMSRADIADYLGLTIETVSRTFTQLKREGLIGLPDTGHALLPRLDLVKRLADGGDRSC